MKEFKSDPELDSVNENINSQCIRIGKAQHRKKTLEIFFIIFCAFFLTALIVSSVPHNIYYNIYLIGHISVLIKLWYDISKAKEIIAVEKGILTIIKDLQHNIFDSDYVPHYLKK